MLTVRELAVSLVRERYADFGPTLAAEKLGELHGCEVSRETLRGWMIAAGLWIDRRRRLPSPHQPRYLLIPPPGRARLDDLKIA